MEVVWITALGVGGATFLGAILGFIFKKTTHRFSDITLSFAAGVMLAAAVIGLILPSLEHGNNLLVTVVGIFAGALCLNLIDKLVPHLHGLAECEGEECHPAAQARLNKVLLFVFAIGIHNLPEGIAAGVGFGTGNSAEALAVAGGILLINYPHKPPNDRVRQRPETPPTDKYIKRIKNTFSYFCFLFNFSIKKNRHMKKN